MRAAFMKLCDITQFYSAVGGGVKRYLQEKRAFVSRHPEHQHVLIVPGEQNTEKVEGNLVLHTIRSPRVERRSRYRVLVNLNRAGEILRAECPDLLECGDPYHVGWRSIHWAEKLEIPAVGFYHSHFPEAYLRTVKRYLGRWAHEVVMAYACDYIRRLYNAFDRTLVPSRFLAALLRKWGLDNVEPVTLGVDVDTFHPGGDSGLLRRDLGIPENRELLLYVGRLSGDKNTPLLLETFAWLARRHPGRFVFLIVGDGGLRPLVEQAVTELPELRWIPYCSDSKRLASIYRAGDVFVHPGTFETFGLVALESQACGLPVAGIRGTYMDANIHAGLEYWSEQAEASALGATVEKILEVGARDLGLQASKVVMEKFSWHRVLTHQFEVYEEVRRNYAREFGGRRRA